MRVCDIFCGPGGISEGLRLAGFTIAYGLDYDRAAVATFRANHPEARAECRDATGLKATELPDCEMIVGGPPCVNFSTSKGNRANILEGLQLVQAFLRMVHDLKPKFWMMENVPRIVLHLPEEIPLKWLGIKAKGYLAAPVRSELNTSEYGVPQSRRRFLIGNYVPPEPTHTADSQVSLFQHSLRPVRTLGDVVSTFPDPLGTSHGNRVIHDPVYDHALPVSSFTDHFGNVQISAEETDRIRRAKTEHPYMGRMDFPDRLDRPARTVVATQLGRETLVLASTGGLRRATVRECASLQSFPISYQFTGDSLNARYRQVGDAVPPLLAYAIGSAIRESIGEQVHPPKLHDSPLSLSSPVTLKQRRESVRRFSALRKFASMIPGKEVRGCRADFDNLGEPSGVCGRKGAVHSVGWTARLYVGEGKGVMRKAAVDFESALADLAQIVHVNPRAGQRSFVKLVTLIRDKLVGAVPDASTLQAVWTQQTRNQPGPEEVSDILRDIVNTSFPAETYAEIKLRPSCITISPPTGIRVRILAGLAAAAAAAELANRDGTWLRENKDGAFRGDNGPGGSPQVKQDQKRRKSIAQICDAFLRRVDRPSPPKSKRLKSCLF